MLRKYVFVTCGLNRIISPRFYSLVLILLYRQFRHLCIVKPFKTALLE